MMMNDQQFMAKALELAKRGQYTAHPNPRVGCVIVQEGQIVGEGYHAYTGGPHAEVVALTAAGTKVQGATCYVTLEPCSHHGLTAPCAEALIQSKIKRCVIAMKDPNPQVSGQGVEQLKAAGIEVVELSLSKEAEQLVQGFAKRMLSQKPLVTLKIATSLDGKTAMASGESQWITSADSRGDVQTLRAQSGAVLMGVNTVIQDDPAMTVRDEKYRLIPHFQQPLRVILDTYLRTPNQAKLLYQPGKTLIIISDQITEEAREKWLSNHSVDSQVELVCVKTLNNRICLDSVLSVLAKRQINDVLVEPGQILAGSFLKAKLVDKVILYFAPKFLGSAARNLADIPGLDRLSDHIELKIEEMTQVGPDIKIIAECLSA